MPTGRYTILDAEGSPTGSEDFRSAPGPAGWRYFATTTSAAGVGLVDLAVTRDWRPARVRIETPAGRTLLNVSGEGMRGILGDRPAEIPLGAAVLWYPSPGFVLAAIRASRRAEEVEVVSIDAQTWELNRGTWTVRHAADEAVDTPVGRFHAERWEIRTPGGGETAWLGGDLVIARAGHAELSEYEPGPAGPFPLGSTR